VRYKQVSDCHLQQSGTLKIKIECNSRDLLNANWHFEMCGLDKGEED
jgi:hypothetical protein